MEPTLYSDKGRPPLDDDLLDAIYEGSSLLDIRYTGCTWFVLTRSSVRQRAQGVTPFTHYENYMGQGFKHSRGYQDAQPTAFRKYLFEYMVQWNMLHSTNPDNERSLALGYVPKVLYEDLYQELVKVGLVEPRKR